MLSLNLTTASRAAVPEEPAKKDDVRSGEPIVSAAYAVDALRDHYDDGHNNCSRRYVQFFSKVYVIRSNLRPNASRCKSWLYERLHLYSLWTYRRVILYHATYCAWQVKNKLRVIIDLHGQRTPIDICLIGCIQYTHVVHIFINIIILLLHFVYLMYLYIVYLITKKNRWLKKLGKFKVFRICTQKFLHYSVRIWSDNVGDTELCTYLRYL